AAGGTVVMPEPAARRDPARWLELVSAEGVTLWNTVPALMEMFVEYLGSRGEASFESLRLVMMSGDWIPVTLPERIRRLAGEVEVISLGGATEASIWSILYPIEEIEASAVSIPYGRAMVNQSFHVLDGELSERPLWVPGELFIGGIGLAQGYWRDPRKTALSFPPNPRPARPGERLYRTGDLGRFLPSGDIEFLGREDFQVKVRGHRIELGEIEAALGLHPAVREAIVVAPGERSRKQLVAVVVPVAGHELSEDDLGTGYLAERLPSYMVPQVFRFLPELPLSANGKVDRAAIERLAEGAATAPSEAGYVAPQGDFEERLAAIWEEILGVERVGVEDNFFELGGDSILGIRIVSRAAEAGLEIRPTALFEHQTIAGLVREQARQSATASPRRPAGAQSALVALQSGGTQNPLFCVHAAGGNVSGYGRLAQALGPDQPLYGLRARGLLPGEEPRQTVTEMADAYLEAIRAVRPEGPYRILGWSSGGHVAFEMAASLLAEGETVDRLILLDTPSRMPQDGAKDERELLLNLLHGASQKPREELDALSFEQQLALVSELLKEAWGLPAGFKAEEAKRLLTVYSTNLAASRAFEPRSYGGRVALLLAGDAEEESADLGWGAWVDGELETFTVPGQHETLLLPKNLDVLASVVGKLLVQD
ncbi:MAG: alpha/beta fold hydrolase, partial [Acidobacteriota bacterium]